MFRIEAKKTGLCCAVLILALLTLPGFVPAQASSGVPLPAAKPGIERVSFVPVPMRKPGESDFDSAPALVPVRKPPEETAAIQSAADTNNEEINTVTDDVEEEAQSFFSLGYLTKTLFGEEDSGETLPAIEPAKPVLTALTQPDSTETVLLPPARKPKLKNAVFKYKTTVFIDPPPPGKKPMGRSGAPLTAKDARLYRQIFSAQARGDIEKADELLGKLGDFRLRGHVLSQRFLHKTAYVSSYDELAGWLALYADHSDAHKIYKLAAAKADSNEKMSLKRPEKVRGITGFLEASGDHSKSYRSARKRSQADRNRVSQIAQTVRRSVDRGAPTNGLKYLNQQENRTMLDDTEYDVLRSYIAYGYLHAGKTDKAYLHASAAASRTGARAPLGGWVAGLVAWQRGDYKGAAQFFESAATSAYATGWMVSGAAYWASRAHMRSGNVRVVSHWLREASAHPRTFYGLIATRALGRNFDFNWDIPAFTDAHARQLARSKTASRAMMLLEAGQLRMAEAELRRIDPDKERGIEEALLAYAVHEGMPGFAMRIANALPRPDGGLYDAALYPLSPWQPENGFKVDLALVHAVIRQESRFNPNAANRSGATGLMQIMPATAGYVAGNRSFKGSGISRLMEPVTNVDIGQRYLHALLGQRHIDNEMFSLTIAYNAGPGNLAKWKSRYKHVDDPLLFIESIPVAETRAYVERVLSNYWIYRMRLGQPTPSLDAVAAGKWPVYVGLDNNPFMLAELR
jgi:soluble lytic murein transglycosylase-like protein